jgi:DNA-binding NarL/FixJ family response regulator
MRGLDATKVWIDDEHPIFRRGLAACLRAEGYDVVGESAGFRPAPSVRVDVVVFAAEGAGLARAVRAVEGIPGEPVHLVALVKEPVESLVSAVVEAGAKAVLLRAELSPESLAGCLRAVVGGNATLPTGVLASLLDQAANGSRHPSGGLTPREVDVLRLLAEGGDTREISGALRYSERTVKNVVHDVLVKMNCRNRAHAVALATRQGVI